MTSATQEQLSLGARLRSARLERGLDLADAALALNLDTKDLRAIEWDRLDLVSTPDVAAAVSAYEGLLDVRATSLPAQPVAAQPAAQAPPVAPAPPVGTRHRPRASRRAVLVSLLVPMALSSATLALAWQLLERDADEPSPPEAASRAPASERRADRTAAGGAEAAPRVRERPRTEPATTRSSPPAPARRRDRTTPAAGTTTAATPSDAPARTAPGAAASAPPEPPQAPAGSGRAKPSPGVSTSGPPAAPKADPPAPPPPSPTPPAAAGGTVPSLVGLEYAAAAARLEARGVIASAEPVESSSERPGYVVSQAPEAGATVAPGTRMQLRISRPPGTSGLVRVPTTLGLSELKAHQLCRRAGLVCATVAPGDGATGNVLRQQPPAGTRAPRLSQLRLFVGRSASR